MLSPSLASSCSFVARQNSLAANFLLQRRIAERQRKHSGDISHTNQNDDSRSLLPALLVSATTRDIGC
jgi:hypothetical protein